MSKREMKPETYHRSTNLIKTRFEKILEKVSALTAASEVTPLTQVQTRTLTSYLTEVKKKRLDFDGNCQRIIEHSDETEVPEADLSKDIDSINDLFIAISSQIETMLPSEADPLTPSSAANNSFQNLPQTSLHIRLPQLDLKHFDGTPQNWTAFYNLFDATVHQNASLSSVLKFQYLLSTLKGEALNLIKSMSISAANYPLAYQILKDRYHNTRRLCTLHLNAILDLPNVTSGRTQGLRTFLNQFTEHSQSLTSLGFDITTGPNPLLVAHLLRKLDQELRKKLESYRASVECDIHSLPTTKNIIDFLNTECNQTEDANLHFPSSETRFSNPRANYKAKTSPQSAPRAHALVATETQPSTSGSNTRSNRPALNCFVCNQDGHKVYSCELFLTKTPNERSNIVKTNKRCYSCLGAHMLDKCTSKKVCNTCQRKHHSLLHFDRKSGTISAPAQRAPPSQPSLAPSAQTDNVIVAHATQSTSRFTPQGPTTVLLGTALVKVTASNGNTQVLRCLIDSGSQLSFISEHAVQLLNAPRSHFSHDITGISATSSRTKGVVQLDLSTLGGKLLAPQHPVHILDRISADLPRVQISPEVWQLTRPYVLADPTFDRPGRLDLLIGGALYPLLFTQESHSLGPNLPHLVGTHFGYVVFGIAPCAMNSPPASYFSSLLSTSNHDLHSSLQRFWTQEEPPAASLKSSEEELCDQHFSQTHSRTEDGRYVVKLPFKLDGPSLGQSQQIAEKRLLSLERKFQAQPQLHKLYVDFMRDCESSGYMTKIANSDLTFPNCFLPHHGVLKQTGDSSKIRVVYDASCKTSNGKSLNETLMTGPKLQTNICDILLNFRAHNFVFTCDIRQMYLQILVQPSDQMFQLVLWRETHSQPISIYKLTRVTFGVNSSPYLAIRTLHQLAEDEGQSYPAAAAVLKTQTYVDDIISGADTVEDARKLQDQLVQLLRKGGFELRKWASNSQELLQSLPEAHLETPVFLEESNQPHFSVLGLHWNSSSDSFTYNLNFPCETPSKRTVLSSIAKIYDPCGFLSPCIMTAKGFMQLLWTTGLSWDEPLPPDLAEKWKIFVSCIPSLSEINIPRALSLSHSLSIQLHGFSDASEIGYAAVIYFRCQLPSGDVSVHQVLAKTRVAPLKRVTLPRLELCAAHLLAQLVNHCLSVFKDRIPLNQCYLWCDSSVALTWLQTPSYRLKTYVANRVAQTQEMIPSHCWHYIPSRDNPADCASRGILASELVSHPLWWTGPAWLSQAPPLWPNISFAPADLTSSDEVKATPLTVLAATSAEPWDLLSRFSTWSKLQRVTAFLLRFIRNLRGHAKCTGVLSVQELREATHRLCKILQASHFPEDLSSLLQDAPCSTRLQRLSPFIDPEGLIRVGGRLARSTLPYETTHPILLPKKHEIVDLLVDHYHQVHLHAGPRLTQALICQRFWILSARQVIRSRIFQCRRCFQLKPRNYSPLMGDLPPSRVVPSRPFTSTGSDYCGPFSAKIHNLRAVRLIKVYICIFICMTTKAVHLEVVTDLTTEAFLAALTRFSSRRGLPAHLFSDCGTNYVGADAALRKLLPATNNSKKSQDEILLFTHNKGITFHFNAPASPHMGGLWESAVKSAKHHLRRVMGDTSLALTELITLVTQIEAILNSRPLTPLSNDPEDCSVLTPGHFLVGAPLTALPEPMLSDTPNNRLKRWQLVQSFHQRIWKRWQLEYLHTLQQRTKWTVNTPNLKIGDLVLIHMNTPPLTWPLARITAVHPGADGVVRVVDLKTSTGYLTRPAVKVFPLPCQ